METSPDRTKRSGGHARSGPLLRTRDADTAPPQHRAPGTTSRVGSRARPGRVSPVLLAAGAAGAAVVLIGGGAALLLGGDEAPVTPSAAAPRTTAGASPTAAADVLSAEGAELSPAVVAATAADRTPAAARAALEEQLRARADGNLALLRSAWDGDGPEADRAAQAVSTSSAGLSAVVASWRDTALATRLRTRLDEQTAASRDYATAVAAGDRAEADRARAQMGEVSRDLGRVLASVTGGRIATYVPPQDAAKYREFVDALEAGDQTAADEAAQWLRARLTREGTALASALSGGGPS